MLTVENIKDLYKKIECDPIQDYQFNIIPLNSSLGEPYIIDRSRMVIYMRKDFYLKYMKEAGVDMFQYHINQMMNITIDESKIINSVIN